MAVVVANAESFDRLTLCVSRIKEQLADEAQRQIGSPGYAESRTQRSNVYVIAKAYRPETKVASEPRAQNKYAPDISRGPLGPTRASSSAPQAVLFSSPPVWGTVFAIREIA